MYAPLRTLCTTLRLGLQGHRQHPLGHFQRALRRFDSREKPIKRQIEAENGRHLHIVALPVCAEGWERRAWECMESRGHYCCEGGECQRGLFRGYMWCALPGNVHGELGRQVGCPYGVNSSKVCASASVDEMLAVQFGIDTASPSKESAHVDIFSVLRDGSLIP